MRPFFHLDNIDAGMLQGQVSPRLALPGGLEPLSPPCLQLRSVLEIPVTMPRWLLVNADVSTDSVHRKWWLYREYVAAAFRSPDRTLTGPGVELH
jgi:hypothetical protein